MAVAIKSKPTSKVSSHTAPSVTSGLTYEHTWKVASNLTSDKNSARATKQHVWMRVLWTQGKTSDRYQVEYTNALSNTSNRTNFSSFTDNKRKAHTRRDFYPFTSRRATAITAHVRLWNPKGAGPWHDSSRTLSVPNKPSIGTWSFNSSTGTSSVLITAAETTQSRERYDTQYTLTVKLKKSGQALRTLSTTTQEFTGATRNVTYDYSAYQSLADGEYLLLTLVARSRGWSGPSADVTKRFVVAPPKAPTIGNPAITSANATGRVTVPVGIALDYAMKTVNGKKERDYSINPVSGVVLQALVDVEYASVGAIPAAEEWDDIAEDNGSCTALTANVGELAPTVGNYSYIRLMTYRFAKGVAALRRYSAVKALSSLHRDAPTGTDDECSILAVTQHSEDSALVTIGYDAKNGSTRDDSDGTELSWSDLSGAWQSTEQPDTFDVTWRTSTTGTQWASDWYYYQNVYVRGLQDGKTYYFRARRYKEEDDSFGKYSNRASLSMATVPDSVEVSAPSVVGVGAGIALSWMHSGDLQQKKWQVRSGDVVLASGSGSTQTTTIAADRYQPYVVDGAVPLAVAVSTGGDYRLSEPFSALVADPPTLGVTLGAITAQPVSLGLTCDVPASVTIVLTSEGVGGQEPDGMRYQEQGDDVWSTVVAPDWEQGESGYAATVELPPTLDLLDGGMYTLTAKATDGVTLLESDEVSASTIVTWAHQAPTPPEGITVTPSDVTDEDGYRTIGATVQLVAAEDMDEEDVYDLYRVTPSGAVLVAEGLAQDATVTDPFAPFGNANLAYRVATRTADGDVDWLDYPYELLARPVTKGNLIRVDFGTEYLELENVSLSDRFEKSFERRTHFGERTGQGYYGDEISHDAGSTGAVCRVYDQATIDAVTALNSYVGPCLVRTSDGRCYQANVTASTISQNVGTGAYAVTLDMQEVALTDYMAVVAEEESE